MNYIDPFTGQTLDPSVVGYEMIVLAANTTLQWPINGNNASIAAAIMEVMPTTTGLALLMPPAAQVSTGQANVVKNIGASTFTLEDNAGNTIASIAPGVVYYIYLTDNSTTAGTWSAIVVGAGTSSANAAALAGYGLTALGATLNTSYELLYVFSNTTLTAANRAEFLVWNSGVGTITLPTASVVGNNWFVIVRNGGTGILTIVPQGTDTIDGAISEQLQISNSFVIVSNGVNGFNTFGIGQSTQFSFTQLAQNVTGGTLTLTPAQAANIIQEYTGTLTSNQIVVLPSTVQLYVLSNNTTGAFSLTFKTSAVGGGTVVLPQNQTITVICDGTNVYSSMSTIPSSINSVTVLPGSAAAPTVNFTGNTTTGLFQPASGQIGFALNGVQQMLLSAAGLNVPLGISGGTF